VEKPCYNLGKNLETLDKEYLQMERRSMEVFEILEALSDDTETLERSKKQLMEEHLEFGKKLEELQEEMSMMEKKMEALDASFAELDMLDELKSSFPKRGRDESELISSKIFAPKRRCWAETDSEDESESK
jgi:chromosome segregation ATPase